MLLKVVSLGQKAVGHGPDALNRVPPAPPDLGLYCEALSDLYLHENYVAVFQF